MKNDIEEFNEIASTQQLAFHNVNDQRIEREASDANGKTIIDVYEYRFSYYPGGAAVNRFPK